MHALMRKFAEEIELGNVVDMKPIPNKIFTYGELEYLYKHGCLYESRDQFIAVVPDSFE